MTIDSKGQNKIIPIHTNYYKRIAFISTVVIILFLLIEAYYRIFNPFPYISKQEINFTDFHERTKLTEYDPILGWKGVPNGKDRLVTDNCVFVAENNSEGFRDVEHNTKNIKPKIVFIGGSYTWGYEAEFNEMSVNLLREKLINYEIFNLSYPCYGTDQELLTFKKWMTHLDSIKLVVLEFTDDDVENNNSDFQYGKPKPTYKIINDKLVLTGIPVKKATDWDEPPKPRTSVDEWKENVRVFFFTSHFIHDMYIRAQILYWKLRNIYYQPETDKKEMSGNPNDMSINQEDLTLTYSILKELKQTVEGRGAQLVIIFIPAKDEIENLSDATPYQDKIKPLCEKLKITYFDLAPIMKKSWRRTYQRIGGHWNSYGHRLAAKAIYNFLINDTALNIR